jgi:hypothetical protein
MLDFKRFLESKLTTDDHGSEKVEDTKEANGTM